MNKNISQKMKRNIAIGLGAMMVAGMSIAGISAASANNTQSAANTNSLDKQTSNNNTSDQNTHKNTSNSINNYISRDKAKEIMQSKVSGATLVDLEFDYDDGRAVYEGELVGSNMEYDITIDAITGTVLEFDKEYEDYDDDRYDHYDRCHDHDK